MPRMTKWKEKPYDMRNYDPIKIILDEIKNVVKQVPTKSADLSKRVIQYVLTYHFKVASIVSIHKEESKYRGRF